MARVVDQVALVVLGAAVEAVLAAGGLGHGAATVALVPRHLAAGLPGQAGELLVRAGHGGVRGGGGHANDEQQQQKVHLRLLQRGGLS